MTKEDYVKNNIELNNNAHKMSCIVMLFGQLDIEGIPYVSWKNNHELGASLSGERDLDLFVPNDYHDVFIRLTSKEGWLCVSNPIASYPWVIHLYKLDQNLHIYHLHVYFKVVTGESWLKEYILPLDHYLIENRVRSERHGIWILNDCAQAYLFAIRHLLKGASITSRMLYYRDLKSYQEEWKACSQQLSTISENTSIRLANYLSGSGLWLNKLEMPNIMTSLKFRVSLLPLLRVPWWSLSLLRIRNLSDRILNRYIYKNKKTFIHGGLIIAISGVDGAGKSTMLNEVYQKLSKFLTIKQFSLGHPQGRFIEIIRKILYRNNSTHTDKKLPDNSTSEVTPVRKSLAAIVLALLRLRMAKKAMRSAIRGNLVLADRWPTDQTNKMDGPRIIVNKQAGLLQRGCSAIEQWAYTRAPRADVCIFLNVPLQIAQARNRARVKDEKESDDEIAERFIQNQQFIPLANKVIDFENTGSLVDMRKALLRQIWREVITH